MKGDFSMAPTQVLQQAIATLLAHDTATLAAALALKIHLSKTAFVPGPGLTVASFTEADFNGYAALSPTAGNQLVYSDPITGLLTVELVPPAGDWHFQTTGILNLPQTIFGWYVTDNASAVLYGSGLLTPGVPLTAAGQGFDLPSLKFAFLNSSPM
jgi:hypothetical protein